MTFNNNFSQDNEDSFYLGHGVIGSTMINLSLSGKLAYINSLVITDSLRLSMLTTVIMFTTAHGRANRLASLMAQIQHLETTLAQSAG